MTKTEQLRATVATLFEHAEDKNLIEGLAKVNSAIDDVENENKELTEKNVDLIKSYKELVKHTSFKEEPKATETQPTSKTLDLEASLKQFLAKKETK